MAKQLNHRKLLTPCKSLSTLAWDGDELVDVTRNQRFRLDGTCTSTQFFLGYPFDRGLCLRDGETLWTIAYDNRGTKAVLLKNGTIHSQFNRSYYFAKSYDYPIALAKTAKGRVVLIHCPNSYDLLELTDAETGEVRGTRKPRNMEMEFHSRLMVSPNGALLLSAGWFWHPLNGAWLTSLNDFDLPSAWSTDFGFGWGAEIDSVAFLGNDHVVVGTTSEVVNEDVPATGLGPMKLGLWSISDKQWVSVVDLTEPCGTIMPWGDWVISFYDHPKAIELSTGVVVHRWESISTGRQIGSIELGDPVPPPIALDPVGGRFAVGGPDGVTVVTLNTSS